MRLSVRQGDKDLLCNQQTIARKYQFSSPVESLEGKFSRQCWVCNREDKSCLYLTAHEKIAERGWDAFSSVWGGTGAKLPDHRGPTEHPIHMNGFFKDTVKRGKWALEGVGKGHVPFKTQGQTSGILKKGASEAGRICQSKFFPPWGEILGVSEKDAILEGLALRNYEFLTTIKKAKLRLFKINLLETFT